MLTLTYHLRQLSQVYNFSPIHVMQPIVDLIRFLPSVPNEEPRRLPGCHDFPQRRTADSTYGDYGYCREKYVYYNKRLMIVFFY